MQLLPHHPVNGQGLANCPIALGWAELPRKFLLFLGRVRESVFSVFRIQFESLNFKICCMLVYDPLLTWRDNGLYDEAGHYLIFQCKLQRWIVKLTIAG